MGAGISSGFFKIQTKLIYNLNNSRLGRGVSKLMSCTRRKNLCSAQQWLILSPDPCESLLMEVINTTDLDEIARARLSPSNMMSPGNHLLGS